jgi:hypothetical protein
MQSWVVVGALLLGACAAPSRSPAVATTPSPAAGVVPEAWSTKLDRDNAQVGKVWDVKGEAFVDE